MERRQELCQSLKGQRAVLPNLYSLFPDWTPQLHPEYARAREESTDPWIKRVVENPDIRRKLQEADCTTFAAIMCAKSSFGRLCTVAKWFTWKVGQVESLVPIIMLNESLRASQAMKVAFMLAQESARGFYEVVHNMRQTAKGRHRAVADIFIEGCRNIVMGLTHWSYTGERYFTAGEADDDNTIHFEL
ncbi:hypothetical protein BO83DRAFT_423397 [Aspergillus eucalypticola CBS 122712]|uniref:Uncharacterized protein n=1 Tax=Aspergillus eucalypticola (strain CBS 122712 / IBT 29274) TaxID=1448314 RepID=A0A317W9Y6_ASPEC|nr:uncharacterized protein BO83DRAFT_423397 [Aspergillus eucalypticola CBS 122712]PWY82581.1 hypothetical protein BO83DRAFT_423397 [Aspergillus eucalypticola CBS 122712]